MKRKGICLIFFVLIFFIPTSFTDGNSLDDGGIQNFSFNPNLSLNVNKKLKTGVALNSSIFDNSTFKNEIFNFIKNSQETGDKIVSSMDDAYYLGKSLYFLDYFIGPLNYAGIINQVKIFVQNARNEDGGYANWKNGRSSMESTFQAINILNTINQTLSLGQVNKTFDFIESLKTGFYGYYPLPEWDVPDMSSTYRALWIKNTFIKWYPELPEQDENLTLDYILSNFIQPLTLNGPSGYSEITNSSAELLASFNALAAFKLLNVSNPNYVNLAWLLDSLTSFTSGGVSGRLNTLPKTGYTSTGIQLFLLLNESQYDQSNYPGALQYKFPNTSLNYLKTTKIPASGFSSSERDQTAELSSTYFVLNALYELDKVGDLNKLEIDFSGVFNFLVFGKQPSFGLGNNPSDVPNIQYIAEGILLSALFPDGKDFINNLTGIKNFVSQSYDRSGGFGFRPNTATFIKYTYYGILALRGLSDPLKNINAIKNYIMSAQSFLGGFGSDSNAQLSYLTHTFWATAGLHFLGEFNNSQNIYLDKNLLLDFIKSLRNPDGAYSNFPGFSPTMASTYRALYVLNLLGDTGYLEPNYIKLMNETLKLYQTSSGGFVSNLNKTVPNIIDTYYGVMISELLGIQQNLTKIKDFTYSLKNRDGGFGLKPKFSSRISSTYYSLLILKYLENVENDITVSYLNSNIEDIFSPIIIPGFIPVIETNKSVTSVYRTSAKIDDPEGQVTNVWMSIQWYVDSNIINSNISGIRSIIYPSIYEFFLKQKDFNRNGRIVFAINALDNSGNFAKTSDFSLISVENSLIQINRPINLLNLALSLIIPIFLIISFIEGLKEHLKSRKEKQENIKMSIPLNQSGRSPKQFDFTLLYILLIITAISLITRIFYTNALPILEKSTFLFQFILGAYVILIFSYVIGLKSYGFFSPMIIVISWLNLGLFWGFMLFFVVFAFGYAIRYLISEYNLAYGFRIGILMISMILLTGLLEVVGETFRIDFLTSNILLPIIIIPAYIDQYAQEAEEHSYLEAFSRLSTTLVIVFFAWLVMSFDPLVYFIVTTPETWIVIIASLVYFGRLQKYTRVDKKRFKLLYSKQDDPLTLLIRNREFISKYNQKILFPIVNKFTLKEQFEEWRVPSPELLGIISDENDLPQLMSRLVSEEIFVKGFVIKPSQSFGGRGILVVKERDLNNNFHIGNEIYHPIALEKHVRSVIQGEFMTSNTGSDNDLVIIEELVNCYNELQKISYGLPDIRIIVFRGIPIMAMARLPTSESGGKANLKQGAIGAGIDIITGKFFQAQYKGNSVIKHPDTGNKIVGFQFDSELWKEILSVSCLAQKSTGLGYAGVDIVIDSLNQRVLVLEVNKRPGLEIQNINNASLLNRFKLTENLNLEASKFSPIKSANIGIELAEKYWSNLGNNLNPLEVNK